MNDPKMKMLCDTVRETAFAAHRFLRHGHSERIYENSLANRLSKSGYQVKQQQPLTVFDEDGAVLGDFFADLLVGNELIVELKAAKQLADEHTAQVLGYLRASRLQHAMLINLGSSRIQIKKFIANDWDRMGDGAETF
jgi:GxxExxY protein